MLLWKDSWPGPDVGYVCNEMCTQKPQSFMIKHCEQTTYNQLCNSTHTVIFESFLVTPAKGSGLKLICEQAI